MAESCFEARIGISQTSATSERTLPPSIGPMRRSESGPGDGRVERAAARARVLFAGLAFCGRARPRRGGWGRGRPARARLRGRRRLRRRAGRARPGLRQTRPPSSCAATRRTSPTSAAAPSSRSTFAAAASRLLERSRAPRARDRPLERRPARDRVHARGRPPRRRRAALPPVLVLLPGELHRRESAGSSATAGPATTRTTGRATRSASAPGGAVAARATAHGGYSSGWAPCTGWYRVSGGSHAAQVAAARPASARRAGRSSGWCRWSASRSRPRALRDPAAVAQGRLQRSGVDGLMSPPRARPPSEPRPGR